MIYNGQGVVFEVEPARLGCIRTDRLEGRFNAQVLGALERDGMSVGWPIGVP